MLVLAGGTKRKTTTCRSKERALLAGTPSPQLREIQVSDKQQYKPQREANSRVAPRVVEKSYPVFIKNITVVPDGLILYHE